MYNFSSNLLAYCTAALSILPMATANTSAACTAHDADCSEAT